MHIQKVTLILIVMAALLAPNSVQAHSTSASSVYQGRSPQCRLPESNAEGLEILSNYYPGYWWDHTDITIAVQAHPSATQAQLDAVNGAIQYTGLKTGSAHFHYLFSFPATARFSIWKHHRSGTSRQHCPVAAWQN
jgi:hypothetical protein